MAAPQSLFPPDRGGKKVESSFKEKLMGDSIVASKKRRGNLFYLNLARVELKEGNHLFPKKFLEQSLRKKLSAPWEGALIVKLLGKEVGFITMRDGLKKAWKLCGDFEMMDLGKGFFLLKFDREDDRSMVVEGGPWMVFDHYLSIHP